MVGGRRELKVGDVPDLGLKQLDGLSVTWQYGTNKCTHRKKNV